MRAQGRAVAALAMLLVDCIACTEIGSSLGPEVTPQAVRSIRVGMTRPQVEGILGPPTAFSKEHGETVFSKDAPDRWDLMTYQGYKFRARWYPVLWVHLEDGRVVSVYAKRYGFWLDDDWGIYSQSASEHWESPEFERFFPK